MKGPSIQLAIFCLGLEAVCLGHGMTALRIEGGVGLQALYDEGSPVSYSEVQVFAPGEGTKPFLSGTTDRNGCFLFRPDRNGLWRVKVDDGMGHAVSHEILWEGTAISPIAEPRLLPRWQATLTGLAILFGMSGWGAFLRVASRRRSNPGDGHASCRRSS